MARSSARLERDATICGSSKSSIIALPSAMRSGQNATSTSSPRRATRRSTMAVTPGYTVLRSTRSWPSTRLAAISSIAACTAWRSGFRCSSIGVPITMIDVLGVVAPTWPRSSPAAARRRARRGAPRRRPARRTGARPSLTRATERGVDVEQRHVETTIRERQTRAGDRRARSRRRSRRRPCAPPLSSRARVAGGSRHSAETRRSIRTGRASGYRADAGSLRLGCGRGPRGRGGRRLGRPPRRGRSLRDAGGWP